jgi:hypothetical protein
MAVIRLVFVCMISVACSAFASESVLGPRSSGYPVPDSDGSVSIVWPDDPFQQCLIDLGRDIGIEEAHEFCADELG